MSNVVSEYNDAKFRYEEAQRKLDNFNNLPEDQRLATIMHEELCSSNHVDACGWYYESFSETFPTRGRYLLVARKVLDVVDFNTAVKLVPFFKRAV